MLENGEWQGFNIYVYFELEIKCIGWFVFEIVMKCNKKLCSVDKVNVFEVIEFWCEVIIDFGKEYFEVELSYMYVDNVVMQLIRVLKQFDVIVIGNMFGDILFDVAVMLIGFIGMLFLVFLD